MTEHVLTVSTATLWPEREMVVVTRCSCGRIDVRRWEIGDIDAVVREIQRDHENIMEATR